MVNPIQAFMSGVTKLYDVTTGKFAYQKSENGSAYVKVTNQEVDVSTIQDNHFVTMAAGTATFDTPDFSWADELVVSVLRTSGTTDTIAVTQSLDGINFIADDVTGRNISTAGAAGVFASMSALTDGTFVIPFNGRRLRFTKGTTDPFQISISARNSGREVI